MFFWNWALNLAFDEFSDIEARLQKNLYRREPRPEFVAGLRSRLLTQFRNLADQPTLHPRRLVILAAISFLSATLVVLLAVRLIMLISLLLGIQGKNEST